MIKFYFDGITLLLDKSAAYISILQFIYRFTATAGKHKKAVPVLFSFLFFQDTLGTNTLNCSFVCVLSEELISLVKQTETRL